MNCEKSQKLKSNLFHKKSINYNQKELKRIKNRKKYNNKNLIKSSIFPKRNNSFINKRINLNDSLKILDKEKNTNNNKSIKIYRDIKTHFANKEKKINFNKSNSERSIFKENRILRLNKILKLCKGEIKLGNNVAKKFEAYNNKISENIKDIIEKESKENKNIHDQQILGKEIKDDNEKDKYKKKENEYFNDMKKNLDMKIEYQLKDINKINQKLENKKKIEKENINKIKVLLEDVYKGKKYLENKINEYDEKLEILKDIYLQSNLNNVQQNLFEISGFNLFNPPPNVHIKKNKIILPKLLIKKMIMMIYN